MAINFERLQGLGERYWVTPLEKEPGFEVAIVPAAARLVLGQNEQPSEICRHAFVAFRGLPDVEDTLANRVTLWGSLQIRDAISGELIRRNAEAILGESGADSDSPDGE